MTPLDQAFVKAYGQPAAAEVSCPVGPSAAILAEPLGERCAPCLEGGVAARSAEPPAGAQRPAMKADPVRGKPARARKRRAAVSRENPAPAKAGRAPRDDQPKPGRPFRPLLEVDAYLWPKTIGNLAVAAAEALEQLAGNLLDRASRGQKVIGWQSCRHGDGCSTLLLAVARRLAEQGLKVAVVDADFRHPRLARRLGLTPSSGWEEAAAGRRSLAEVVVESLRDGIVLAPWCGPTEPPEESAEEPFDADCVLEPLRRSCDYVLVDLGHGSQRDHHAPRLASVRSCLDLVLVIHHVGEVPAMELSGVCRELSKAGKAKLAIVENFV